MAQRDIKSYLKAKVQEEVKLEEDETFNIFDGSLCSSHPEAVRLNRALERVSRYKGVIKPIRDKIRLSDLMTQLTQLTQTIKIFGSRDKAKIIFNANL